MERLRQVAKKRLEELGIQTELQNGLSSREPGEFRV